MLLRERKAFHVHAWSVSPTAIAGVRFRYWRPDGKSGAFSRRAWCGVIQLCAKMHSPTAASHVRVRFANAFGALRS
jgi:hypothetical protein